MQNLSQLSDVIDPLATAAKSEPENIGHRVCVNGIVLSHTEIRRDTSEDYTLNDS